MMLYVHLILVLLEMVGMKCFSMADKIGGQKSNLGAL